MSFLKRVRARIAAPLSRLSADVSGLALIEFAYTAPVLLTIMAGGAELTNYSITHMRVSQIAVSLADNASRAKQGVVTGVPKMREVDVNEAFAAAEHQAGQLDIKTKGRLILSSLEVNDDDGQWIHWQRCYGDADYSSSYGDEGDGETGTSFAGMGPTGRQVTSEKGFAIMFAEVVYDYDPMLFGEYLGHGAIRKTAAMYVRDERDLSGLYNPAPTATVNACD